MPYTNKFYRLSSDHSQTSIASVAKFLYTMQMLKESNNVINSYTYIQSYLDMFTFKCILVRLESSITVLYLYTCTSSNVRQYRR